MSMILYSEKLNPQYNQNSVLTMPWIAWGAPSPVRGSGAVPRKIFDFYMQICTFWCFLASFHVAPLYPIVCCKFRGGGHTPVTPPP